MPSDRILEEICEDGERLIFYHTEIPGGLTHWQFEATYTSILWGTMNQVAENFRWGEDMDGMITQKLCVVSEALKNAIVHGSKNKDPVYYGLFMGDKGVCYGFQDSGNYFRLPATKMIFESKTPIREFSGVSDEFEGSGSGFCCGVNHHIYLYSDIIEVDTEKGVLYCVQYRNSLENKKNIGRQ